MRRYLDRKERIMNGCDYCADAVTKEGKESNRAYFCKFDKCPHQIGTSFVALCERRSRGKD